MKNHRIYLIALFLPLIIFALVTCDDSANNEILSSWVQAGPNGTTIARVISSRDTCPDIVLNGEAIRMEVRH